jgi:hypothetical protein
MQNVPLHVHVVGDGDDVISRIEVVSADVCFRQGQYSISVCGACSRGGRTLSTSVVVMCSVFIAVTSPVAGKR